MARCESNYLRLCKVFPGMAIEQQRCLGFTTPGSNEIILSVSERTRFTTLIVIEEQSATASQAADWSRAPTLNVRLYHDAKLAEVVSFDRARGIKPSNPYPNKKMLQRDEKAQWNLFLEEWLIVCIQYGYVVEPVKSLVNSDAP
jgi:hypothetical protein